MKQHEVNEPPRPPSPRECDLLLLLAEGHSTRQVASLLFMTPEGVERARARLLHWLGVPNATAAVALALRKRWIV